MVWLVNAFFPPSPSFLLLFHIPFLLFPQRSGNKKSPAPYLGQDFHPAVPPKLTLTRPLAPRASTRAARITGAGPVGSYSVSLSPHPHKSIHRSIHRCDLTIHNSLQATLCRLLLSLIGFLVPHYTHPIQKCQYPFSLFFANVIKFFRP